MTLELGGNAAAVVCADWSSDADLDRAASRVATFANYQGGQSCISVQRVLVDSSLVDAFLPRLVAAVEGLGTGDPADDATSSGRSSTRRRPPASRPGCRRPSTPVRAS